MLKGLPLLMQKKKYHETYCKIQNLNTQKKLYG